MVACAQHASGETRTVEMPLVADVMETQIEGCSSSSGEAAEAARCQDPKHEATMK